jgi:hypothetical protein
MKRCRETKTIDRVSMAHNRKIVLTGVALTLARANRYDLQVMSEIMDEMESAMVSSGFLHGAPFKWVGLTFRYGLVYEHQPHFQGIDTTDGEIALAIELDVHDLVSANRDKLKEILTIATLKTLIDVGKKYALPYQKFEEMLAETQIPRAGRP